MNRLILKRGEQPNKPLNAAHLCFFYFTLYENKFPTEIKQKNLISIPIRFVVAGAG
jgi:hypothetical protein